MNNLFNLKNLSKQFCLFKPGELTCLKGNSLAVKRQIVTQSLVNRLKPSPERLTHPLTEDFFKNTEDIYIETRHSVIQNNKKKDLPVRGALIFAEKYEYLNSIYTYLRAADKENRLSITRLGNSLSNLCPIIEYSVGN